MLATFFNVRQDDNKKGVLMKIVLLGLLALLVVAFVARLMKRRRKTEPDLQDFAGQEPVESYGDEYH